MHRSKLLRLIAAPLLALAALAVSGCATPPTAVSADTEFKPNEGLVAVRLVELGDVPIKRFSVVSEATGEVYPMRAIQFGQTSATTYVGRLPAGRYQPKEMWGTAFDRSRAASVSVSGGSVNVGVPTVTVTVPLTSLTGKFDVQAKRITDLGTIVFVPTSSPGSSDGERSFSFALPLLPIAVPTDALVQARFPALAKAIEGRSALSWVSGTVPQPPRQVLDAARQRVIALTKPTFAANDMMLTGGAMGVIDRYGRDGLSARRVWIDTPHAIEAVVVLQDGRWLAGGEEGFLAISSDQGASWQPLTRLSPEDVVVHLSQAADKRVFMVVDRDREAVVYQALPTASSTIEWKELRRLPSDREQGVMTQQLGEAKKFWRDHVAVTDNRLVVYTRPGTLHSFDFRSNAWESNEAPYRSFHHGLKATPDGLVIGMVAQHWVYTSLDYGRSWTRMESFVHMTEPHFVDSQRGIMLAAEMSMLMPGPYKIRTTKDGGKTWTTGAQVGGLHEWMQPVWTDPSGKALYTTRLQRIELSKDQGQSWMR
jgi:photosystem II stability/assembly factor-like uncharacterized protein